MSGFLSENDKDRKIREIIEDLANDKEYTNNARCNEHSDILNDIYKAGNYVTKSSDIFRILSKYFNSRENKMEILQGNLEKLSTIIFKSSFDENTIIGFSQFCNAVNLEIGHYNFYKENLNISNSENDCASNEDIVSLKKRIKVLENNAEISNAVTSEAKKTIINIDDRLEKNSISSITALTIFSAVVLAFSGGLTVISSIFEGMAGVSPLRLVFCGAMLGFILFNTIFMLLYVVGKMTGKNISSNNCFNDYCDSSFGHQNSVCRLIHRYPYVFFINAVFLLIFYYSAILYFVLNKIEVFCINNTTIIRLFILFLPIIIIILLILFSYQPFIYKIQQKRFYNEYKLQILSNLALKTAVPNYFKTNILNMSLSGSFERNAEKDLVSALSNALNSTRNTNINVESFLEKELECAFTSYCLYSKKRHFIPFSEDRQNKENLKCTLRMIKSYYK